MRRKYLKETGILDSQLLKELSAGPRCLCCGSQLEQGEEIFILRRLSGTVKAVFCQEGCSLEYLCRWMKENGHK